MNKERKVIEPGTIIYFDRDVEGEELRDLSEESLIIVINGDLTLEEDFYFEGDLYVGGNINGESVDIAIDGSLNCNGEINIRNICITGDFKAYDHTEAYDISVDGDFYADCAVGAVDIKVGRCFWALDVDSASISVGEDFCCESVDTNDSDINVAGDFESEGEVKADFINVLGRMHVTGNIEANEIKVGYYSSKKQ